jgi:hypothetical protein
MQSALYSCPILMKLEFSRQIFKKYSNIMLHENASAGCQFFSMRADRHDEANSRCWQFCERALKNQC